MSICGDNLVGMMFHGEFSKVSLVKVINSECPRGVLVCAFQYRKGDIYMAQGILETVIVF